MKLLLTQLLLAAILVSCSDQKPSSKSEPSPVKTSQRGLSFDSLAFGLIEKGETKVLSLQIKNGSSETMAGPVTIDSSDFKVVYQSGCEEVRPNKICNLKISFDSKGKIPGNSYSASLNLDSHFVELSALVQPEEVLSPEELSSLIRFHKGSSQIDQETFGTIRASQSLVKTITVRNFGTDYNGSATITGDYSIAYDSCSNKNLAKNKSCLIKVLLSGKGKSGTITGTLNYRNKILPLNAQVIAPVAGEIGTAPEVYHLQALYNNLEVSVIDGGILVGSNSRQLIVNFFNKGNTKNPGEVASVNNGNFEIIYNQCQKPLNPGTYCNIRLVMSASGRDSGIYEAELSFDNKVIPLKYQVIKGLITYIPSYSPFSGCSTAVCQGEGIQTRTLVGCQKQENGQNIEGGQLSDCAAFEVPENLTQICPSPAGEVLENITGGVQTLSCESGSSVKNFVSVSCNSGYFINGQLCSEDVITYQPSYSAYGSCSAELPCQGEGLKSRTITSCQKLVNGQPSPGAVLENCDAFAVDENLKALCFSPAGNKVIQVLNGEKTVFCAYASEVEEFQSITCNSPLREPNQDNTACLDKNPTGFNIAFDKTHTNLITNKIIASSSGAQNVRIYNQASCIGSGNVHSLPLSLDTTYVGSQGEVNYSAVFINNSAESECLNFSYIYDTQATGSLALSGLPSGYVNNINSRTLGLTSDGDLIGGKILWVNKVCSQVSINDFADEPTVSLTNNYQVTPLANSTTRLCAIGVDRAGNWQTSVSSLGSISTDLVSPSTVVSLNHDNFFNSTTQTPPLTWTVSTDLLSGLKEYEIAVGSSTELEDIMPWTAVGLATSAQPSLNLQPYSNEVIFAKVRSRDNAGNISGVKISSGWFVGQPAVNLSVSSPTPSDKIKVANVNGFRVAGICSEIDLPVLITLGSLAEVSVNCEADITEQTTLGSYETFIDASTLPQGAVNLVVKHSNALPYTRTLTISLSKDTIAPIIAVTSPANNSSYEILNNRNFQFSGTCTDSAVPVVVTSSINVNGSVPCNSGAFNFVTDLSDFDITSISFSFRQTDLAGNLSNVVGIALRKGTFDRVLDEELDQIDYPNSTISTLLGTNTGKMVHLISANNDTEGALAISNTDGSEYLILTPPIGNSGVSVFSSYQGAYNDRLVVFHQDTQTLYFRQRIPNSNAVGVYSVAMDGSNYREVIGGSNATHPDWEVIQFSFNQSLNKIMYISDEESDDVFELYSMNLDGSNRVKLNAPLAAGGSVISFYKVPVNGTNPERVVYYADQWSDLRYDLFLANLDGSNINGATKTNQLTMAVDSYTAGETRDVPRIQITNNGLYAIFSHTKKAFSSAGARYYNLYSATLTGATPSIYNLTVSTAGREMYTSTSWHLAPNQAKVAFTDDYEEDGVYHVYTTSLTGGSRIRITPDMSASSRDYLYVRWHTNSSTLFMMGDVGTTDGYPNIYRANGTKAYNNSNSFRALTNITSSSQAVVYTAPYFYSNGVEYDQSTAFRSTVDGRLYFICDFSSGAAQAQLCQIHGAATVNSTYTSLVRVNASPSNNTADIAGFVISPSNPAKVAYLFDGVTDNKYELYVYTPSSSSGTNVKVSNEIAYSAGSVEWASNYWTVDWVNNIAIYSANDSSPYKYAYTAKLDGSSRVKIGEQINVSDVDASMVVGNNIVFLADLDRGNQSELYKANADGSGAVKISAELAENATILPNFIRVGNTNKVLYVSTSGTGKASELRIVDVVTGVDTLLNTGSQLNSEVDSFAITMNLNYVVYISDRVYDEVNELWASKLDGTGTPVRLNPSNWGATSPYDVIAFTIAPDSNTVAVLHDSWTIDNKWVYHITKIGTPSTWVNVTYNSSSTSASYIAFAPAVFSANSATVCFVGDLITNSDFDIHCSASTGSPSATPTGGNGETDLVRNITPGFLMTNPTRDRIIYRGNLSSDSQFNLYSMSFTGGSGRTLTPVSNSKQNPIVSNQITITGVNQEVHSAFYGDNLIYRADAAVDEKYELYMSSVIAATYTGLRLNQPLDANNDVHSYFVMGDKVVYLANVGSSPRLVYSRNLTGPTEVHSLLSQFENPEGGVLSFYPAGDMNTTYVGINGTGNKSSVIDCYLSKTDGSNFRKLSPNLAPDTVGCNRALVDSTELNLFFQADVFNFGVMDLFKQ